MPIDFTGLYGQALPTTRSAAAESPPDALLRGAITSALVTRVAPVDNAARELLMARATQTALQLTSTSGAPSANPASSSNSATASTPPKLTSLLTQPALHLASLRVRGYSITTLTDQPLQKGQQVLVQLNSQRQLQLLTGREAQTATTQRPAATTSHTTDRPQTAINQALRQLLPQRDQPDLLSQLPRVQQALRHLPPSQGREQLQQLLQQLIAAPQLTLKTTNHPVTDAVNLRQAVVSSGVFLEQQLAQLVANPNGRTLSEAAPIFQRDLKALLLQVLHHTRAEALPRLFTTPPSSVAASHTAASSGTSPPTTSDWQQAAELVKAQQLPNLLQLLAQTPPRSTEMRQLQIQLVVLLHQATLANLARIRVGQLTAETASARAPEAAAQPQAVSISLEVPLRFHGEWQPVHLRIEEEPGDETKGAAGKTSSRKAWRIHLRMDTPAVGELYAQLYYLADHLKVDFWSEKNTALSEARQKFQTISQALKAAGIEVEHVLFHHGKPAQHNNLLSYALVDIKT